MKLSRQVITHKARELSRALLSLTKAGKGPGLALYLIVIAIGAIMAIPILYIIIRAIQGGSERWVKLLNHKIPDLLWNTFSLTFTVTLMAIFLGCVSAWLVNKTNLPGRKVWNWALALPMVIPSYVGAVCYIIILGPRGLVSEWLGRPLFDIYTFLPLALILAGFTYPYVYLIVSASLKRLNVNLEEAARSCGLSLSETFFRVVIPILRPAIGAGGILVALYVLSEFGAVALLRYSTFTAAIYYEMGSFDRAGAAVLSILLIAITLGLLWLENKSMARLKYYQTSGTYRTDKVYDLGKWKWLALTFVGLVVFGFALLPISVLIYWSWLGISNGSLDSRFWGFAWNSFSLAALAAVLCMAISLPFVYITSRFPSRLSRLVEKISYAGNTLPGVIVALGVIFIYLKYLPFLYGTGALLVTAYILRFLPQAIQAGGSTMKLVSPRLDEAALSLGKSRWQVIIKVILPLIKPGLLAGSALVFVSAVKELPATLLLRPAGLDTLAVRVWVWSSEGMYELAAPSALLILVIAILPLRWMINKY